MNSTPQDSAPYSVGDYAMNPRTDLSRAANASRRRRWVGIGMTLVALPATALTVALSAPAAQAWPSLPTPHITIPTVPALPTPVYTIPPLPTGLPTPPATSPATPTPTPTSSASPSSATPSSSAGHSGSGSAGSSGGSRAGTGAGSAAADVTAPPVDATGVAADSPSAASAAQVSTAGGGLMLPAIVVVGILALVAIAGLGWLIVRGRGTRSSGPGV